MEFADDVLNADSQIVLRRYSPIVRVKHGHKYPPAWREMPCLLSCACCLHPRAPCPLRLSLHVLVLMGYHACVCRSAEDNQDRMSQMEFRLPAEALVPLPGSAPAPRPRPTAAAASSDPFDAFGSPPATAAAARDDFADLEAIGAPKGPAAAGMPFPPPGTLGNICLS